MQQVPHLRPKNIQHHQTKFIHPSDGQAHGIRAALCGMLSGIGHFFFVNLYKKLLMMK